MKDVSNIRWIDARDGIVEVAAACRRTGRCAMDTEADSFHSYHHQVCLVQVTANGSHFVIDPLALSPEDLGPLWELTADPEIKILMHGADYDLRILDRDYGAKVTGLVDTQIMAQLLGEPHTGLAALLAQEFDLELDKRFQRANWKVRPLSVAQLEYAAADTAFLEELVQRLGDRLQDLGRAEWAREEFGRLEKVRFIQPPVDGLAFERIKGARKLRGEARDRMYSLYLWREEAAEQRDVPPFKVLGNAPLVALAAEPPAEMEELSRMAGVGPRVAGRWGRNILEAVANPDRAPERVPAVARPVLDPSRKALFKRLVETADRVATELGLTRGLLCPRSTIDAIANSNPLPSTRNGLESCGLVGWRLQVLGQSMLVALAG